MADGHDVRATVERVVAEVFEEFFAGLRTRVVDRVLDEIGTAAPAAASAPAEAPAAQSGGGDTSIQLNSAANNIQGTNSQGDILSALLEGAAQFGGRVALFVTRGSGAVGWKARGFGNDAGIKDLNCDTSRGLAARAIQDRMAVSAAAAEFSSDLVRTLGNPADGNAIVLPLLVRDKVPALLYADRGTQLEGRLDSSALELLVRTTGLWLETVAARRAGTPASGAEHIAEPPPASESGKMAAYSAPAASAPEPPAPVAAPAPAPEPAPAPAPAAAVAIAPGDEEVHKKARRFAKLLVDEIRLYNQAKVAEGRAQRDLYDRLKDDIEKSRATYDKRYGSSPAAAADYFNQELVRILGENDAAVLGANFPRA